MLFPENSQSPSTIICTMSSWALVKYVTVFKDFGPIFSPIMTIKGWLIFAFSTFLPVTSFPGVNKCYILVNTRIGILIMLLHVIPSLSMYRRGGDTLSCLSQWNPSATPQLGFSLFGLMHWVEAYLWYIDDNSCTMSNRTVTNALIQLTFWLDWIIALVSCHPHPNASSTLVGDIFFISINPYVYIFIIMACFHASLIPYHD